MLIEACDERKKAKQTNGSVRFMVAMALRYFVGRSRNQDSSIHQVNNARQTTAVQFPYLDPCVAFFELARAERPREYRRHVGACSAHADLGEGQSITTRARQPMALRYSQ